MNTLEQLLVTAITSSSYKYAREVLGRCMYLLSIRTTPLGRRKRSLENEGRKFLQRIREQVLSQNFDKLMDVEGEISLVFVIDHTGSMNAEIHAAKQIAKKIANSDFEPPVHFALVPFNDPFDGRRKYI